NLGIIATLVPEKEKAHIAGLETFLGYMGSIFGALILGYIAEKYSLNAVFVIMAIIAGGFFITACIIKYKFDIQHKKIANHHHHFIHHAHAK
ncbi:MAG: hypothetical protein N4A36_02370, partial [Candidatus Gracilibacteria bacterium]|nr:hypothetical protein [Candidatus Gracilibacteria bacterium]